VGNADALHHGWVAKDRWHPFEVLKESDSGPKQYGRNVDAELVEKAGVHQLLDGVSP
jgi:hypothetical protein